MIHKIPSLSPAVVKDKVIAVRVDYNVPIWEGRVTETTRIEASIPTLKYLLEHGAKRVHILSHLGRPKGEPDPALSLKIVQPELEKFLGEAVEFRSDFTSGEGRVQLHENVRFWPGEKKNDPAFIQELLGLGADIFVSDGFAVCHRAHASVVGMASFLPAYPGFLVQKEIDHLSPYLSEKKVPGLVVVIGGAKIETKAPVLRHFARTAEHIIIGGALANTFAGAQGVSVGESFRQEEYYETARDVFEIAKKHATGLHLPLDVVCAKEADSSDTHTCSVEGIPADMKVFDIGPRTIQSYSEILGHAKTVLWNGPVGMFEQAAFENGTRSILKMVASLKSTQTILGGGDTLEALKKFGVSADAFTHVSTGGGAMLEFLEGKELPGIEVLYKHA